MVRNPSVEPSFSIVIPVFNRPQLVCRAVDSCLRQTYPNFDVIVVDDGSDGETRDALESRLSDRVRYIRQDNAGAAVARNRGGAEATGDYIAFLDSDDEFLPSKLAAFADAIAASSAPGRTVFYSPLFFYRGEGNALVKPDRAIRSGEPVGDYLFASNGMMQTSTLVIPRNLFLDVQFDPSLRAMQDLDLCIRLEAAGAQFSMLPEPQAIWYDDSGIARISNSTSAERVQAWVDSRRSLLSEKAYVGFRARFLAPRVVRQRPAKAIRMIFEGYRAGTIRASETVSIPFRGGAPETYAKLRDYLVRRRERNRASTSG